MKRTNPAILFFAVVVFAAIFVACGGGAGNGGEGESGAESRDTGYGENNGHNDYNGGDAGITSYGNIPCPCGDFYIGQDLRTPTPPLNVRAWSEVPDDFLEQFGTVHELTAQERGDMANPWFFVSREAEIDFHTLILWPDEVLSGFNVVALYLGGDGDGMVFFTREVLHTIAEFSPGDVLVLNMGVLHYLIPRAGLAFTDESGERRRMFFGESMRGGCWPAFSFGFHDDDFWAAWDEHSPFVTSDGRDSHFIVHGFGGYMSFTPEFSSFYLGGRFIFAGLEGESIEGAVDVTQDSLVISFMVERCFYEYTGIAHGTVEGPGVNFEYIPGVGVAEVRLSPYVISLDRREYFYFSQENVAAMAQSILRAIELIDEYRGQ